MFFISGIFILIIILNLISKVISLKKNFKKRLMTNDHERLTKFMEGASRKQMKSIILTRARLIIISSLNVM